MYEDDLPSRQKEMSSSSKGFLTPLTGHAWIHGLVLGDVADVSSYVVEAYSAGLGRSMDGLQIGCVSKPRKNWRAIRI